jgi:hypothetical protein
MTRQAIHSEPDRPLLRGICLVVKGNRPGVDRPLAPVTVAKFPRRPDSGVFSESIPLFFIGRNSRGLWIAREAEGRTGGVFLFKQSALRFARKNSAPLACATMFLAERFELDVENHGNRFVPWLNAVLRKAAQIIPAYPPPVPIGRKKYKGEWR